MLCVSLTIAITSTYRGHRDRAFAASSLLHCGRNRGHRDRAFVAFGSVTKRPSVMVLPLVAVVLVMMLLPVMVLPLVAVLLVLVLRLWKGPPHHSQPGNKGWGLRLELLCWVGSGYCIYLRAFKYALHTGHRGGLSSSVWSLTNIHKHSSHIQCLHGSA